MSPKPAPIHPRLTVIEGQSGATDACCSSAASRRHLGDTPYGPCAARAFWGALRKFAATRSHEGHTGRMTNPPNRKRRLMERLNLVYPERPSSDTRSPLGRIVLLEERVSDIEARLRRLEEGQP
jgi:hypothetical protein